MSAGRQNYTWLDDDEKPVTLAAQQYITLMQNLISRNIGDEELFPTDPHGATSDVYPNHAHQTGSPLDHGEDWLGRRSGFPRHFDALCRVICQQMFCIYAHLYWNHFEDFHHLSLEKALNSCFSTFVMVTVTHGMIQSGDLELMQDLINLWAANGIFPADSKPHGLADLDRGKHLLGQVVAQ